MFEEGIRLKKKHGEKNVYDFSLGNPNVDHPEAFKRELIKVADQEIALKHGYTPNAGYYETRQSVARKISKKQAEDDGRSYRDVLRRGGRSQRYFEIAARSRR